MRVSSVPTLSVTKVNFPPPSVSGAEVIPPLQVDDQERTGPRLMTRDPLFHSNNAYTGQEELGYV